MGKMNELPDDAKAWAKANESRFLRIPDAEYVVRNRDRRMKRANEPGEVGFVAGDMRHGFGIHTERKEKIVRSEIPVMEGGGQYDKKNRVSFAFKRKLPGSRVFGSEIVNVDPQIRQEKLKLLRIFKTEEQRKKRGKRRRGKQKPNWRDVQEKIVTMTNPSIFVDPELFNK